MRLKLNKENCVLPLLCFLGLSVTAFNIAFDGVLSAEEIILVNSVVLPICYPAGYLFAGRRTPNRDVFSASEKAGPGENLTKS